jgi:hypothetical protein
LGIVITPLTNSPPPPLNLRGGREGLKKRGGWGFKSNDAPYDKRYFRMHGVFLKEYGGTCNFSKSPLSPLFQRGVLGRVSGM